MKVTISLDDDLMRRLDNYSDDNYMSRSGLISLACTQFLNAHEITLAVKEMALCMRRIADKGEIDEETQRQLEGFESFAKILSGRP